LSTPLRLVIFDVDGTLVDSQRQILAAMAVAFEAAGIEMPARTDVLGIVGLSLPVAMSRLVPDAGKAKLGALVEGYKSAYMAMRDAGGENALAPLYPYARDALDELAAVPDILLGIATGKSRRGLDHLLAAHDLGGIFVTEQVADHHPSKPHPSMLHRALAETGADPAQAVMIGDTGFDMEMACAAGFHGIGVSWGYHSSARLASAGAGQIIGDFRALPEALTQFWNGAV